MNFMSVGQMKNPPINNHFKKAEGKCKKVRKLFKVVFEWLQTPAACWFIEKLLAFLTKLPTFMVPEPAMLRLQPTYLVSPIPQKLFNLAKFFD